jgi:hypothetical protein
MNARAGVAIVLLVIAAAVAAAVPEEARVLKVEREKPVQLDVEWPVGFENREALVNLQFDLLANGKAANIRLAEGGFHNNNFVSAAILALKYSRWEPRRIDGKPVDALGKYIAFKFPLPDMQQGITAEFRRELLKVDDLLRKGDYAGGHFHAEWMLSDVVKLNYEYAVLHAQLAETYAVMGKIPEATERARRATVRPSAPPVYFELNMSVPENKASNYILPKELVSSLLGLRMRLAARQGLLAEAMLSYYELAGLVELPSTDPLSVMARDLTARIQGAGNLVAKIQLNEKGLGTYHFARHRFTLKNFQIGSFKRFHIRCSAGTQDYEYRQGVDWTVPAGWGGCVAAFEAEPGTTFDIVEYPGSQAAALEP